MLAKQPASLGGFEFDAIIKRSETMTCDVPEYATEEGYSITDNIADEYIYRIFLSGKKVCSTDERCILHRRSKAVYAG